MPASNKLVCYRFYLLAYTVYRGLTNWSRRLAGQSNDLLQGLLLFAESSLGFAVSLQGKF